MLDAAALETLPLLAGLGASARTRLGPVATRRVLDRGGLVFEEHEASDHFHFVLRGRVKLLRSAADGSTVILHTAARGQLVCGSAPCSARPFCCTCVAMEDDTEVMSLERGALLRVVGGGLAAGLLRELCQRTVEGCHRIETLAAKTIERRIALLLLNLATARASARRAGAAVHLRVRLSRQELAAMCGTTVETAIRVVSRLRRAGVVRSCSGGLIVVDLEALQERADGPPA